MKSDSSSTIQSVFKGTEISLKPISTSCISRSNIVRDLSILATILLSMLLLLLILILNKSNRIDSSLITKNEKSLDGASKFQADFPHIPVNSKNKVKFYTSKF